MNTMRLSFLLGGVIALAAGLSSCGGEAPADSAKTQAILDMKRATDHHSYSRPEEAVVTHLWLLWLPLTPVVLKAWRR